MTLRLSPSVRAQEHVRALGAGPAQDVLVGAVAADGRAAEDRGRRSKARGLDVEDDDVVAGRVPELGGGRRRRGRSRR